MVDGHCYNQRLLVYLTFEAISRDPPRPSPSHMVFVLAITYPSFLHQSVKVSTLSFRVPSPHGPTLIYSLMAHFGVKTSIIIVNFCVLHWLLRFQVLHETPQSQSPCFPLSVHILGWCWNWVKGLPRSLINTALSDWFTNQLILSTNNFLLIRQPLSHV